MMWRYYELLTDVQVADIEKMKTATHPMAAKKDLARRIVADFHSADAAARAGEDWAKQFQKDGVPENVEEVSVALQEIGGSLDDQGRAGVRLDRILVKCGMADSTTDAGRKLKQGSVKLENAVQTEPRIVLTGPPPARLLLRVGKQLKVAVIRW
jgi:tyrosyl-tRNA synthetase